MNTGNEDKDSSLNLRLTKWYGDHEHWFKHIPKEKRCMETISAIALMASEFRIPITFQQSGMLYGFIKPFWQDKRIINGLYGDCKAMADFINLSLTTKKVDFGKAWFEAMDFQRMNAAYGAAEKFKEKEG